MTRPPREPVVILGPWRRVGGSTVRAVTVVFEPPRPRGRICRAHQWDAVMHDGRAELRVGGSPHVVHWRLAADRAAYWTRIRPGEGDEAAAERALREANGHDE